MNGAAFTTVVLSDLPSQYWLPGQDAALSVSVDGRVCSSPSRVSISGLDSIQVGCIRLLRVCFVRIFHIACVYVICDVTAQCTLPMLPVGYKNTSVVVAGLVRV
jgi:hypothetical protein